jgi:uncharacterized membrane protein
MSDSKFAKQLIGELPSLVDGKIIDANSAESLRRHYQPQVRQSRSLSIGLTISAVLGGLLIGAGIILLLAHNWDELTRPMRAVLSMLPLVISVLLAGFTILRRPDSTAWREGSGIFYFLSIGASIALVSQTYHLYNDLQGFLLVWMLLALPLVYLLGAGTAFIGFLACLVWYNFSLNQMFSWRGYQVPLNPQPLFLLLAVLPFFAWQVWKRRESLMTIWLSAALSIALPLLLTAFLDKRDFSYWQLSFGGLFTLMYLVSCHWFGGLRGWRNPFRAVGCLGIAVIAIILTFREPYRDPVEVWQLGTQALVIWLLAAAVWVGLVGDLFRRKLSFNWLAVLFPGVIALGVLGLGRENQAPLLMNFYVFALGVFTLVRGVKRDSLLSMNEGLLLLTALIISRFFDGDYGFVARGVAFIVVGFGFLGMNLWVLINRKNKKELSV